MVHRGPVHRARHEAAGAVVVVVMVGVQAPRRAATASVVLGTVAWREAVLSRRHVRVTNEPAGEVRGAPGVLVTPPGRRRRRVQRVVVAVVVVHGGVVRESRHQTHNKTEGRPHNHRLWMDAAARGGCRLTDVPRCLHSA